MTARFFLSPSRLARYFFHDCDRHLRFSSTPFDRRAAEGVPEVPEAKSAVTEAILDGGYVWEERVVEEHLGTDVNVAAGEEALRDRSYDFASGLRVMESLAPGEYIYQPTLEVPPGFYDRYGLDRSLIEFRACRPDLILAADALRIIDVKASEALKATHRVQIALYALILREILAATGSRWSVDLATAGVWLYERGEPRWFDLSLSLGMVETFLRERLPQLLARPTDEVSWHLQYRCEACEYYRHCKAEALESRSVSLIPYLTTGARRYLREADWSGGAIDTLPELAELLDSDEARDVLAGCGSLKGRRSRLRNAIDALESRTAVIQGGSSVALPVREQVRLVLTIQKEPLGGNIYAAGFLRQMGKDVYGDGLKHEVFVARSPADCVRVRTRFLEALYRELQILHDYNSGREFREQKGLQTYVFDQLEARLFNELLIESTTDPELAAIALGLLFHYQNESVAESDEHPGKGVPYPIVNVVGAIQHLVALGAPVAYRLQEVSRLLAPPRWSFELPDNDLFAFELSSTLKSDAVLMLWRGGADTRASIVGELRRRLRATSSVVDGLRHRIGDALFAWPPKFQLPPRLDIEHPVLSRLAFVVRYESFMRALALRGERARPYAERVREGFSIPLICEGGGNWRPAVELDSTAIDAGDFPDHLLVPAGRDGDNAQMGFDDYRFRNRMWVPKGIVSLASVVDVETDSDGQCATRLRLKLIRPEDFSEPAAGDRAVLHPRYTDFTSERIVERLRELDAEQDSDVVRLLEEPSSFAAELDDIATGEIDSRPFTPSQRDAFVHLCGNRLTLVWGPPGTGKTHFLAQSIASLGRRAAADGRPFRVVVTAFTHAAIENLLAKIDELAPELDVAKLGKPRHPAGQDLEGMSIDKAARLGPERSLVLGGTIFGLRKAAAKGMAPAPILVVDEGSQMKLGELALGMVALAPGGRLVIAGDHLQLPPIISGNYPEPEDGRAGLEDSAFAYLRDRDGGEAPFTFQLQENWRMNHELSRFSADSLYGPDYRPASEAIGAQRIQLAEPSATDSVVEAICDPETPAVACVLDGVRAAGENLVEAQLVAKLSVALRERLLFDDCILPATEAGDRRFWREGLFIVSPHHVQIRAIQRELASHRTWHERPFVDTVDKMQGQQCQAVIVSYGVSDRETALGEAEFIYSLNRLNVAVTRARAKCVVFLPRPLLEPSFDLLSNEKAAAGLGHMHRFVGYAREGDEQVYELGDGVTLRVLRR